MKRKTKERIGYIALNMAFILLCLVTLIPIYYAVNVSFSGPGSSLSGDFSFLPENPSLENYRAILFDEPFLLWLKNSLLLSVGTVAIAMLCAVTAAYWLLRTVMRKTVRKTGSGEKLFRAGMKTFRSFCCLTVPTILAAAGICSFSDISDDVTRPLILYIMLGFYILAIFRELQIFSNCCSFLSSILYLCALEILPTGILLLPAVLL